MTTGYLGLLLLAIILLLYFFGSHIIAFISWFFGSAWDLVISLIGYALSTAWYVLRKLIDIVFSLYWSLISAHPLIFISCFVVVLILVRVMSLKINPALIFVLVPIISTVIGEVLYGGISLKVDIRISDAGLLLASTAVVFALYYAFVKSGKLGVVADGKSLIHKILNQSFVIVLVLMVGAFSIALVPLLKQSS